MLVNRSDRGFVYPMLLLLASAVLLFQYGCPYLPESTFELSAQSRSPKWMKLPPGVSRSQVSISMSYYNLPWDWFHSRALFILRDSKSHVMRKVTGKACGNDFEPASTGQTPSYPSFSAIAVDGETELIEHKAMEPMFYVTDDAVVQQHYRTLGCF